MTSAKNDIVKKITTFVDNLIAKNPMTHNSYNATLARHQSIQERGSAIERVIDRRRARGAGDEAIVGYLQDLKSSAKNSEMHPYIAGLIEGIQASPSPSFVSRRPL